MIRHAPAATALVGTVAGLVERAHTFSAVAPEYLPLLSGVWLHHIAIATGNISAVFLAVFLLPLISLALRGLARLLELLHGGLGAMAGLLSGLIVEGTIKALQATLRGIERLISTLSDKGD